MDSVAGAGQVQSWEPGDMNATAQVAQLITI